jgi:transcriptional regulator with XRE-family HTH domain
MTVNENIKRIRKERGLTQKKLGELCGIAEPTIRRYEAGTLNPKIETVEKLASALGITAVDLMGVEYWDKKYPSIAKESKEYEGFIDYLNALGYVVNSIEIPSKIPITMLDKKQLEITPEEYIKSGFVPGTSYEVELIKDGKSLIFDEEEFKQLQGDTKDMIALKLWQKSQEKK